MRGIQSLKTVFLAPSELGASRPQSVPLRAELPESDGAQPPRAEEVYLVISGSGRVKLDDEIVKLKQWDVVRVAPSTVRPFEGGPEGLELVAVGSDRPEGGDGERVDEWWSD